MVDVSVSVEQRRLDAQTCSSFEELWDYIFDEDSKTSFYAVDNPVMNWDFFEDIIYSDKFQPSSWNGISKNFNKWRHKVVENNNFDYNRFISFYERLIESNTIDHHNVINHSLTMFVSQTGKLKYNEMSSPEIFIKNVPTVPGFFIEKIYSMYKPVENYYDVQLRSFDIFVWLKFLAYPTLSVEFKQKLWSDHHQTFKLVANEAWFRIQTIKMLNWENIPHNIIYDFFVLFGNDNVVQFLTEYATEPWHEVLIEKLEELYPELDLTTIPKDWLHELVVSSLVKLD